MKRCQLFVVVGLLLIVGVVYAQEAKDIVIGGEIVARLRDKGPFESVAARHSHVEKCINEIISYEDTQHPRVKLQKLDGIWTITVGTRECLKVYPGDARPQNMDPRTLGELWRKKIEDALPRVTPVSRLPQPPKPSPSVNASLAPTPRVPTVLSETEPAHTTIVPPTNTNGGPITDLSAQSPGTSTEPTGGIGPTPTTDVQPAQPPKTPRSAGILLLLDAFSNVRAMTEEEYLAARDRLAANLLENLEPFVREAGATEGERRLPQPEQPPIELVTPKPGGGAVTLPPPVDDASTKVPESGTRVPTIPRAPTVEKTWSASQSSTSGNSSTARVPQKERIKRKFAAAKEPFAALKAAGDPRAAEVEALLRESRAAHTAFDFDTSEAKVDAALKLMGVPIPK
ncbi:MAG: hypothetical protein ACUVX8_13660 [Candidatus Zipacnadales bacterium]